MKSFERVLLLLTVLLVTFGLGCKSNSIELTNEMARDDIKNTLFPEAVEDSLDVGVKVYVNTQRFQKYKDLAKEGLLIWSEHSDPRDDRWYLTVELTEQGKEYVNKISNIYKTTDYKCADIKLADKEFLGVTGIFLFEDRTRAQVDYTWRYANITPFAKHWGEESGGKRWEGKRISTEDVHEESARMILDDDGWRIVK